MENTHEVIEISNRIELRFQGGTHVYVGALFRELVREYVSAALELNFQIQQPALNERTCTALGRRMCELSREIIFSEPGIEIPPDMRLDVGALFRSSLTILERVSLGNQTELNTYVENIQKRCADSDPWEAIRAAALAQV